MTNNQHLQNKTTKGKDYYDPIEDPLWYDLNDGTGEEIYVNRSLSEMDEDPYDGILFISQFSKNLGLIY